VSAMTHIAGVDVSIGPQLRQRCSWCGAVLIDVNVTRAMVADSERTEFPTWPIGALIRTDGCVTSVVPHVDGTPLPDDCCGQLDYEVTGSAAPGVS